MKHRDKLRLARKLQTPEEAAEWGKGPFESSGWTARKEKIAQRVQKGGKSEEKRKGTSAKKEN